jgi:hypothetical protein
VRCRKCQSGRDQVAEAEPRNQRAVAHNICGRDSGRTARATRRVPTRHCHLRLHAAVVVRNRGAPREQRQSQAAALRAAKARSFVDDSCDAMALISDDCEIRNLSPASRIMLGNAPHELASTSIDDLVSPEDLDPMRSTQSLVMSSVVATRLGVCAARCGCEVWLRGVAARCGSKRRTVRDATAGACL